MTTLNVLRSNISALLAEAERPDSALHEHRACFEHLGVTLADVAELGAGRHAVASFRPALQAAQDHLKLILAADEIRRHLQQGAA